MIIWLLAAYSAGDNSRRSSFPSADESEKQVRSSAVKLLVRHRLRGRKIHHRQKLCEELRAEMPPRVPEKIVRCRRQTTDGRAFQVGMELVDDDERLRSFSALLDDPEWVAAMEEHGCHDGDVEFSESRRQIVNVTVVHPGFGL
jgi:hypothetical protein